MDQIKQQIDQLSELDDQQIEELQNSIVSEFDTVEQGDITPEAVDNLTTLADFLDNVRDESARREQQKAELASRAADAAARVKGADEGVNAEEASVDSETAEAPAADAVPAETATDAPAEAPAETETPSEDVKDSEAPAEDKDAEDEDKAKDKKPEPVAASAAEEASNTDEPANTDTETVSELATEEVAKDEAPAETELSTEESATTTEAPVEAEAAVAETTTEDTQNAELSTEETASEVTEPETELSAEAPAEAAAEVPAEAEASNTENTNEQIAQEEAPVTAAAEEGNFAPADRRPLDQAKTVAPVAITAGADIPGVTAGSEIDKNEIASLMEKRLKTIRRVNGGDGEQHIVASVMTTYPESRTLGSDSTENTHKLDAVVSPTALAASGGFSAPLEASYDLFPIPASDARPVRDALPRFQAERGGVRYLKAPGLASYQQAVGVWTNQNDIDAADPASDLTKNVLIVGGVQENTAYTDAITLQLQFGNLMTRAFPELIARHNELALIQHARVAEINLLSKINAASKQITARGKIGFARELIVQIKRAAASFRSRNRMESNENLRAIVPAWILDAAAADLVLQMPGDDTLGTSAQTVNGYLGGSNVTVTASLDQNIFGAQNAGELLEFPDTFTWYLFPEGSFVFLDGGTLEIGVVRDSGLVGTNDYRMFLETFEGLAFIGDESLAITSTISVNGTAAALVDTVGGNASATDF